MIKVSNLTVDFGRTRALDKIDLQLDPGRPVVISGENGAGKSTLLWVLAGLLLPSSGRVEYSHLAAPRRPCVGFLSHQSFLYEELTVQENLELIRRLYELNDADRPASDVLQQVGLADRAGRRVSELSRGQVQRVSLAAAMMASSDVLLLDEPFAHLDRPSQSMVMNLIASSTTSARVVVSALHDPSVLSALNPRVVEIREGKIRA